MMPDWDAWGDPWMNDFEREDIPQVKETKKDDWVATCGVCDGNFVIAAADSVESPSRSGTFCPDCRVNKLKAPGVLHWRRRSALDD